MLPYLQDSSFVWVGNSGRGVWGLQSPNNLLKIVDFLSENGCESQVVAMKIRTPI